MSDLTLAEFLAARLSEDEAWAQLARSTTEQKGANWRADHGDVFEAGGSRIAQARSASVAPHIARHDPARVLREAEAGRKILDLHLPDEYGCQRCEESPLYYPCSTLRALAAVYSDHEDYREEWA